MSVKEIYGPEGRLVIPAQEWPSYKAKGYKEVTSKIMPAVITLDANDNSDAKGK